MALTQSDLDFDHNHLWHPYTNLQSPTPVYPVESAQGVYIQLDDGSRLIDGMASWWSMIHGYNHPQMNQAICEQVSRFSHVMFGGLTHQPAIELGKKLVNLTRQPLQKVFLADSGSVAVEVGLKMALQYWYSQGRPQKNRFLTFRNGYHGDTFGAMSVCDPENGMHSMFSGVLPQHLFVSAPECRDDKDWQQSYIAEFADQIEQHHQQIAAVIVEPLVQGAGGMRVYCPEYLRQIRRLCDEFDVLLMLDEIATGFGRTGTMFAYEQAQIVPDILCVGKALTGGYMSLAATITTDNVANTISGFAGGNLMHGPTFMANPLACAAANQSIELLTEGSWQAQIKSIEIQLTEALSECRQLNSVADVRVKGAIGVIELKRPMDLAKVHPRLKQLGVWLRPFGKLLYCMPPYIIEREQLSQLTSAMVQLAEEN